MELEVKLLRANVWLAQRTLQTNDGFLVLMRVSKRHETLAYGALENLQAATASAKRYQSVAVKWIEPASTAAHVELLVDKQQCSAPIELLLFVVQRDKKQQQQRFEYIGQSALRVRAEDADALRTQHELVFSTALDGGLGAIEVKLRHCAASSSRAMDDHDNDPDRTGASSFSVNWSSSEALQRDLEDKARVKAEREKTLVLQLRKVAASALRAIQERESALRHQRLWWAAARIQRAYRALARRRREAQERVRIEQRALLEAKKARVRAAVVERNLKRAQAMREQLRSSTCATSSSSRGRSMCVDNQADASSSRSLSTHELAAQVRAEHEARVRATLQRRLAALEAERDCVLRDASSRSSASGSAALVDAELVRAVRAVHFGK